MEIDGLIIADVLKWPVQVECEVLLEVRLLPVHKDQARLAPNQLIVLEIWNITEKKFLSDLKLGKHLNKCN